jgi:hypothetical protein
MSSVHASREEEHAALTSIISNQLKLGNIPASNELQEFTADLVAAKLVEQTLECVLIRLSDFLDAEAIDEVHLLKVDVQKSELDLMGGVRDEHWDRIKQIVVEVHNIDRRRDRMVAELSERGYTVSVEQDVMFAGSDIYYLYARRGAAQRPVASTRSGPPGRGAACTQVISSEQLKSFLASCVSAYQMPESIEILPDFARTVSGKIDRSAIARRASWLTPLATDQRPNQVDPLIAGVIAVWTEVLGKPVTVTDDFFEIGGNSLSAARVITRIRERYAPDISIRLIFEESRLDIFAAKVKALLPTSQGRLERDS